MLPPHCGQTRLMMEEMMLAADSPGSVSIRCLVALRTLFDIGNVFLNLILHHPRLKFASHTRVTMPNHCGSKMRLQMRCQSRPMEKLRIRYVQQISQCRSECGCPKDGSRKTFCGHAGAFVRAMSLSPFVNHGNAVQSVTLCPCRTWQCRCSSL